MSSPPPPPDLPPTHALWNAPRSAAGERAGGAPTVDSEAVTLASESGDQLPRLRPPLVAGDLGAFGGHRVLRLLGRGGMGAVYEAVDIGLGRPVALKLMLPALAASPTGRERFLREARAAAAIRHENVINVYQVGEDDGVPFLTMELLQGEQLARLIKTDLPIADLVRIGREVALGLAAAHKIGVVHRDIKPANIWIEAPSGRVRLLDFGLAHLAAETSAVVRFDSSGSPELTQAGEFIGTPIYMSPEQAAGDPIDFRTDLFSLGAVLCQAITGGVPFSGTTSTGWASAIRAGTYVPVDKAAPATPPALARLIHALLALRPEDRPPSADAVAEELLAIGTQLLIDAGSAAVPILVAPPVAPEAQFEFDAEAPVPRRPVRVPVQFLLGSAAALVAVFLALGIVQRVRKGRHPTPAPVADAPVPPAPSPNPNALPKGFASLFNGRDLSGLKPPVGGKTDAWSVANGALVGTPQPNFTAWTLLSDRDYSDFELRLEYRLASPGGHALVLLRANDDKERYGKGLSISLADDTGYKAVHNREVADGLRTGVVPGFTTRPAGAHKPQGEWNALRTTVRRHTIEIELNGVKLPTADLDAPLPTAKPERECFRAKGPVGLLCYFGTIEYRNVMVSPLP